jgi:hypothetical protein
MKIASTLDVDSVDTSMKIASAPVSGDTTLASFAWAELMRLRQPRIAVDHVTEDE